MTLPLNALRAFEAAARHLSFTAAGRELNVSQSAVAAQVKNLESRVGVALFRRLPRGLALTDEGRSLLPLLTESFGRLAGVLDHVREGRWREPLGVGAVGTFTVGWLMPRLAAFEAAHPGIDLRLSTHNNRVDLAGEGLDYAIRFGAGAWHGTDAEPLMDAPMAPMATPALARTLRQPVDLLRQPLLRSFRPDEWPRWFAAAGVPAPPLLRGPVLDSSLALAFAAMQGAGIALLPVRLFERERQDGRLAPCSTVSVPLGRYWLTRLQSRAPTAAMRAFRQWLLTAVGAPG
ncbi:LysR family transcriptional regulator [Piscinibacter sakaiensis]|uniref:Glycine cleavage system transcriptional activator n=1 Tax=Piscinibacter sakaiensis TaxID=1547922 RepID=A0A0K8P0N8_PISS1|nr:LysR family transcriptional regulator [Piscinibacter sakaiensis]GAP36119.1 glycine cleavage system transcriptional activator [Piscinibacter sakaiensis]